MYKKKGKGEGAACALMSGKGSLLDRKGEEKSPTKKRD